MPGKFRFFAGKFLEAEAQAGCSSASADGMSNVARTVLSAVEDCHFHTGRYGYLQEVCTWLA